MSVIKYTEKHVLLSRYIGWCCVFQPELGVCMLQHFKLYSVVLSYFHALGNWVQSHGWYEGI